MDFTPIRIVLVNTSHPGNIGATARAMKTMGLSELVLVAPKSFPDARATEMASNADDVLANARVVPTLPEAIADCGLILGASARLRSLPWPLQDARTAAATVMSHAASGNVAILFGREDVGLSNEELQCCHYHVHIPTNPVYPVLNIAAAVQIICYEIRMAAVAAEFPVFHEPLASADEVARFHVHLEEMLTALRVYNPAAPKQLLPRLRRLFQRVQLESQEVHLLRGMLRAIEKKTHE